MRSRVPISVDRYNLQRLIDLVLFKLPQFADWQIMGGSPWQDTVGLRNMQASGYSMDRACFVPPEGRPAAS